MQRPKFFFVGGVNGSGKTTVLHLISEKKPEFHVIKGSEYFMKWLGIKRRNYGQLQSLPDRKTLLELGRMMRYLLKEKKYSNNKKIVLIDAHFTNIRNGKTEEWISDWLSLVNGLVLIKAKPAEILKRIRIDNKKKTKRQRNLFPTNASYKEKIKFLQLFNKKSEHTFRKCVKIYKKQHKILLNKENCATETAKALINFLEFTTR